MLRPAVALSLAALACAAVAAPATAANPRYVRLSWSDAFDTATSMTVTWNSDAVADPSTIEYGPSASYGHTATGTVIAGNGALNAIHTVALSDLDPDTEYHYRVGGPGQWSADYTFRTGPAAAPGCAPFRFIAMGDGRSDDSAGPSPKWNPILAEAVDENPQFILLTGDQVRAGDDTAQWVNWLAATEAGSPFVPLMPTLGNHDDDKVTGDGAMYNQIFALPPNAATNTEDFYFFTYGDAIFVSLSMVSHKDDGFAQQAAWLDQVLTDNPRTWKFVYFHHPIYTGTLGIPGLLELNHPPNELGQNAALVPVFDEHHVDVVFNGHNHHYQRYQPACCGGGGDHGVVTGDPDTGTTYVITGGAGALTYDLSFLGLDLPGLICLDAGSVTCSGRHHFMVVDVDGLDLNVKVWSTSAQLLDTKPENIALIDEFSIHKDGPAPDCDPIVVADPGPEIAEEGPVEAVAEPVAEPIAEPMADTSGGEPDAGPLPDTATSAPDTTAPAADTAGPTPDTAVSGADTTGGTVADPATTGSGEKTGCAGGGQTSGLLLALLALLALAARRRWADATR
ncbi:MAG: hypothetical protein CVU56_03485 [Deltaproteobacteria bacterium HGW-Deltaproteobacteria-14]|jgi:hypothetical protein|nr:MAG: hypothetical protein CVU56_03485 [Deltaproteobacteria bacterium HGW-Deltaproteobacteria-14]